MTIAAGAAAPGAVSKAALLAVVCTHVPILFLAPRNPPQEPLHLGRWSSEAGAARAHDVAALALQGTGCAGLNFPAADYAAAAVVGANGGDDDGLAELAGVPLDALVEALRREAAAPALRPARYI